MTKTSKAPKKSESPKPKCPECEPECTCEGGRLQDLGELRTDWYGVLHYWRCRCCKTKLVSQNSGELETAAL
jgi:hypothetical protein